MGKKKAAIKWDSKCQQAFNDLKTLCTMAPILAYKLKRMALKQ